MKIAGAGTSRTTRGVADTNRNAFKDAAELDLEVLVFGVRSGRRILHERGGRGRRRAGRKGGHRSVRRGDNLQAPVIG